jgi:hypothetical protein
MKKSSVFEWHRRFQDGPGRVRKCARRLRNGHPKRKGQSMNHLRSDRRLGVRLIAEESYGRLFVRKTRSLS